MQTESDYYLAFQSCNGIGPKKFAVILAGFQTATQAWQASKKEWLDLGFPPKLTDMVWQHKQTFDFEALQKELARLEIKYLAKNDTDFPPLLREIADCPIGIFIKGSILAQDSKALAVVGTRKVTSYGREVTEKFVTTLASRGFTIISGLARGVDGISHKTALTNGGRTLAVLGCGLDEIYPPEHKQLASEIIKNGALISEYPPHTQPMPGNFPARNRLISGLSLGVLVTEGSQQSGTNITAMMAVDQNREVFAIPGPITSQMSTGPAKLIQMGAKLVLSVEDIVSELGMAQQTIKSNNNGNGHSDFITKPNFTDKTEEYIWQMLLEGNQHVNDIGRQLQLPIAQVSTALTMMELKGLVKSIGEGKWMAG